MGIAALFNVPSNNEELAQWAFNNMAHHRDIILSIYHQTGVLLPEYVLDPVDFNDPGTWMYNHQIMHSDMDNILGIQGFDLLDVNWQDRGEFAGWIFLHSQEHYQASNILGV